MIIKEMPASEYVVFHFGAKMPRQFRASCDNIYINMVPQLTCQLNRIRKYVFAKYGEEWVKKGKANRVLGSDFTDSKVCKH